MRFWRDFFRIYLPVPEIPPSATTPTTSESVLIRFGRLLIWHHSPVSPANARAVLL